MIRNEREYRITRTQAAKSVEAVARVSGAPAAAESEREGALRTIQLGALRSQLADLRDQMQEYEALRSAQRRVSRLTSFDQVPRLLIQARIAAGLTQKQLADELGLKAQQIQRYEATDYASASFERVRQVLEALGLEVSDEVALPGRPRSSGRSAG